MKKIILGFDPGQTGAVAAYDGELIVGLIDMPTMTRLHGKGQQVDPYTLTTTLLDMYAGGGAQSPLSRLSLPCLARE